MTSDETLMLLYKDGDTAAFEQLYLRHKAALYRYLFRQTSDRTVAEDLFQEIWLNLIKASQRYEHKAKFSTYLFRVAHNRLIDYYRSKNNAIPISYDEEHVPDKQESAVVEQPEQQVEISRGLDDLCTLLNQLPEAQREVFLLKEESGMSLEEIAQVTGCNKETVKSRLRYAVSKLRVGMKSRA